MTTTGPASEELDRLLERYERNRNRWARAYYGAKVGVILLGAAIPILTTVDASPRTIAIAGGLIVAIEGVSQLCSIHERYIAARVLFKNLKKERILFQSSAGAYAAVAGSYRERTLGERLVTLLDMYDTEVLDVITGQEKDLPPTQPIAKPGAVESP